MKDALVTLDVYVLIVSRLPASDIYALWCTGRELRGQTTLFNHCILPVLRFQQWHRLCKWALETTAAQGDVDAGVCMLELRAGPFLESQGPFMIRILTAPSDYNQQLYVRLRRARALLPFLAQVDKTTFASAIICTDNLPTRGTHIILYYEDPLKRYEIIHVRHIEYWRWTRKIVVSGTVGRRGHLNKNRLTELFIQRKLYLQDTDYERADAIKQLILEEAAAMAPQEREEN